jgi:L-threonylcarbamoyladenylate synthase
MPEVVMIDPDHPGPSFSRCGDVVRSGGIVVYPTDTFYGLGADPRNSEAVKRLFHIKGRAKGQPILLLISSIGEVHLWAAEISQGAEELMQRFWPGPLTLVFKARNDVNNEVTGNTGTIGLRVPGNSITRQLLSSLGTALTGTSANRSGERSIRSIADLAADLAAKVDLLVDGGTTAGGMPSTIVDVSGNAPVIIREGMVPSGELFS